MASGCCGYPSPRRRRVIPLAPPLPANPKVPRGVRLLYLGSGTRTLKGRASGLVYHVSEQRRWFTAHPDDVAGMPRLHVILAPP